MEVSVTLLLFQTEPPREHRKGRRYRSTGRAEWQAVHEPPPASISDPTLAVRAAVVSVIEMREETKVHRECQRSRVWLPWSAGKSLLRLCYQRHGRKRSVLQKIHCLQLWRQQMRLKQKQDR